MKMTYGMSMYYVDDDDEVELCEFIRMNVRERKRKVEGGTPLLKKNGLPPSPFPRDSHALPEGTKCLRQRPIYITLYGPQWGWEDFGLDSKQEPEWTRRCGTQFRLTVPPPSEQVDQPERTRETEFAGCSSHLQWELRFNRNRC